MKEEKTADCPTVSFTTDMRQVDYPTTASIPLRPLLERYPDGFNNWHSLHRKEGDI